MMDDISNTPTDAWASARLGNAIDALVDRAVYGPQMGSDPAQAYGVDQNGRVYTLGQTNSQVVAQVNTGAPVGGFGKLMPWLLVALVVYAATKAD